jgi:hypothetical protein
MGKAERLDVQGGYRVKNLTLKKLNNFVKERDAALLSLDRGKILAYCRKYQVHIPSNEKVFWAAIHKAKIALKSFPESEKEISRKWLSENRFKEGMGQ